MGDFEFYEAELAELTQAQRDDLRDLASIHEKSGMNAFEAAKQAIRDKMRLALEQLSELEKIVEESGIKTLKGHKTPESALLLAEGEMLLENSGDLNHDPDLLFAKRKALSQGIEAPVSKPVLESISTLDTLTLPPSLPDIKPVFESGVIPDLRKKTVRIYGYGLFECFMAMRLAESFGKVELFTPWKGSYPVPAKNLIGAGLPGVTRIDNFFNDMDSVDLFCFFDVGDGDIQEYLRKQGKRVFGSGSAEALEYDRATFRNTLKAVGLPVGAHKTVTGIKALAEELKRPESEGKWIKLSTWRGVCETFQNKAYGHSITKLDNIAAKLGAYRDMQEFIIEDNIPGTEPGDDRFYANGVSLPIATYGFEIKDKSYICKAVAIDDMPEPIKHVARLLEPVYKKHNVCGMMSSEVRIGKDREPYFIDQCARAGSPPSELICELYENFAEIVWKVAGGEMATPRPIAKYAAEVLLKSDIAPVEWVPLAFKEADLKRLKLRNLCKIDGQYYYVPQDNGAILGAAIGFGNTLEEAQAEALENAKLLDCEECHYASDAFAEAREEIDKGSEYGLGDF